MIVKIETDRLEGIGIFPFYHMKDKLIINPGYDIPELEPRLRKLKAGQALATIHEGRFLLFYAFGEYPQWKDILMYTRKVCRDYAGQIGSDAVFFLPEQNKWQPSWTEALTNGIKWSSYSMKPDDIDPNDKLNTITLIADNNSEIRQSADRGIIMAEIQMRIADLVNAPANRKTPEYLGDWATVSGQAYGYDVKVLDPEQMEEEGLFAILEVGKASIHTPRCIIAEYSPDNATHTLGLVGKGVTFDTGGISIKSSANLHFMKCDMGGAAAILGTIEAIARLQLPIRIVAVIPCAENAVDGKAYRPGDIIRSHAGKNIEIIDTDAEGRLLLADALSYLHKQYKTDTIIDLATLTGSSVTTLGYHAAALFCNDPALEQLIRQTGSETGEKVWPLPLWKEYEEDLHSDVADIRNFSGKPVAGAITAAKFLEAFIMDHPSWAHLDIAGVAFKETEFGKMKNATSWGVRLLVTIAEKMIG